ncbi:pyridoxal phosphate-dependent aminotransferase [Sphingobacterium multivorum]|jgi:aspartate/methionine/tyrosine aminotransferase|uniref:Aminotransferase class I/II-fold pyridoxal phosphate-dependent enzyme n=2 Tax=Sphingobacterium TaxID=28453 RepID=A0ACD5C7S6_9SPHI|nr:MULTISPECIES: aminotransferase class I/II-fold pyridoxal phosphate-dependent enzyme [Sphingobacterium]OJZ14428.1 MAG: LL-diaminopimelate aminotransferase [Sphingobacterium sp. 40-24]QRY60070.1 aminotransferase class I/II-fold pyridoxal phosphate-dependent enzyme [Sphingobacterium siyangense]RKF42209.1 LL-diaminopimelate aminotransferase [Sphingobacterium siyangense]WET67411.1 MAG: aminotransferase class I/II-fold pyridoxal phosphate-dependent enzyme [Sphingobacterium sp.]
MQIDVAKRLQHTEEYYFSKKLREIDELNKQGARVINLGIGSPDLPPHPEVIETLNTNAQLPNVHGYQNYKGAPALRQAVADWYQRYYNATFNPNTEILPLIGSKEGIVHICMTYLQEGDQALIPNPGYPAYAAAVRLSGAEAITYNLTQEKNWLIDLNELKKQDLSKVKLMWINYPHMPTGASAPDAFYQELIQFAKEYNILICHDNPYSFILTDTPRSIMSIPGAKDVAIELNSLSKSSNMAGWRIGVLVGAEERINQVLRFKSNMDSGMFLPVQLAAAKALQLDASWYADLNKIYAERRQQVYEIMDLLDCSYQKDQVGLFVWARIPEKYKDGYALSDAVLDKSRVFITPGGIFGDKGDQYIRISLCATVEVLKESIQRIKDNF